MKLSKIWNGLKNISITLASIISIETLRHYSGLPFTVIDVVIFPITVILLIIGFRLLFFRPDKIENTDGHEMSLIKRLGYSFFIVLLLAMSVWSMYEGWNNPLTLYSGVKGSAHGYTLFSLGFLITAYTVYFVLVFIFRNRK